MQLLRGSLVLWRQRDFRTFSHLPALQYPVTHIRSPLNFQGRIKERYTEQAWTDDVDELVSRVDQFDVDDFGVQLLAELKLLVANA